MLIITIVLVSIVYTSCYTDDCSVGFLHDDSDWLKRLAFSIETEKLGLDGHIELVHPANSYNTLKTTCRLIETGMIAIFGPQAQENSQVVHSVCQTKDIPHIETRWTDNQQKSTFTINLYPHSDALNIALAEVVKMRKWETFMIFYEDNAGLSRVSEILKVERDLAISIRQLNGEDQNYRPILKEARKEGHTHFILDCHIENLPTILEQAQQIGLMTSNHYYIISNLDLHTIDMDRFKYSDTNITGIRIIDPEAEALQNLAKKLNTKQSQLDFQPSDDQLTDVSQITTETALLVDGINFFKLALDGVPEINKCISSMLCNDGTSWSHGASAINEMKVVSYEGLTGIVKLDSEGFRSDFTLDIVELREDGLKKFATWNTTSGIKFVDTPEPDDLKGSHFTVITALTEPYGMLTESLERLTGNARYEGFAIDIIHELSLILKFNYTFIIREDKANGKKDKETGKWDGMIGDLIDEKADLAITDLTINSNREEAVDFTNPFMNLGISILYTKPKKSPPNFFSFAEPFALEVWLWLGGSYFIVSVSLFIMGRLCPSEWTNPYPCIEEPEFLVNQFSLRNSFWFTIGSLMQQGTEIAPIAYATRMTAGMWWFFTLIMVSSYTANLAAFLATENVESAFNDVYDLLQKINKTNIKIGAKTGGATMDFFKDSGDEELNRIYTYMLDYEQTEGKITENKQGVNRAKLGEFVFFMESVSIEYETQRECDLHQVGGLLDEKGYGIAMRKEFVSRHKLSTGVLKLLENGKVDELKRKWWEERKGGGACSGDSKGEESKPLTLENVGGVFWVTFGGACVAMLLVFVEMIMHVMKETIKHKASLRTELTEEIKFHMKFKGLVKPVRIRRNESKSPEESEKSDKSDEEQPASYGFVPAVTKPPLE